ncbi:hypothetical protein SDJN03_16372, partial [Cucurbita argyrosperma subsp. sororia]
MFTAQPGPVKLHFPFLSCCDLQKPTHSILPFAFQLIFCCCRLCNAGKRIFLFVSAVFPDSGNANCVVM